MTSGQEFLDGMCDLAQKAMHRGTPAYKLRPKLHALACKVVHRMKQGSRFNPRFAWLP